jgi:4a-hydroxytetrahydrobiopterin dehydratase
MQALSEAKPLRHAMRVDVSVAREHVHDRLQAAVAAAETVVAADVGARLIQRSRPAP